MNEEQTWSIGIRDDDVFVVDMHPHDDRQSEPAMLVRVRMGVPITFEATALTPRHIVWRVMYTDGICDEYDIRDENLRFVSGEDLKNHNLTHW